MNLREAIDTSRVLAARGYTPEGQCVVSVADYGGQLIWLTGFKGVWATEWQPIPPEELPNLDKLDFRPTNPPPVPTAYASVLNEIARELEQDERDAQDELPLDGAD